MIIIVLNCDAYSTSCGFLEFVILVLLITVSLHECIDQIKRFAYKN